MLKSYKLKELGSILTGNTPSKSNKEFYNSKDIMFIKPDDIGTEITEVTDSKEYISQSAKDKARIVPENSLLITCIGSIGKIAINKIECAFNQQINAIIPNSKIYSSKYLGYAIVKNRRELEAIANAPVVPIINKTQFSEFEVIIHDEIEEQKKTVEILDKAQELIDKRKAQIEALDELVKSKFIEMFGDPAVNPMGWPEGTIRDIVTEVRYGTSRPAVEGGKYKYLRMNNITYNGELDTSDLKYIDIPDKDLEKYIVRKGDVLFNRTNSKELVGKTCVFNLDEPMVIAGYIIRIRMNERALPEYLSAVLNSKYGKQVLYGMCKTIVGQANINAQELQDIKIFIPPIELQKQYVDFIKQVEKIKSEMKNSLKELENNFNSLMQKAFKGELFN